MLHDRYGHSTTSDGTVNIKITLDNDVLYEKTFTVYKSQFQKGGGWTFWFSSGSARALDFYSDRAVSFGSFFLSSIFGLVTLLAIIQNIPKEALTHSIVLGLKSFHLIVVLSIIPYFSFALSGFHCFKQFTKWADKASLLEMLDLRELAKLGDIKFERKGLETNLLEYLSTDYKKLRESFIKKCILNHFNILYWVLILLLAIIVFFPKIFSP